MGARIQDNYFYACGDDYRRSDSFRQVPDWIRFGPWMGGLSDGIFIVERVLGKPNQPPAIAPMTNSGSRPAMISAGNGLSGAS